MTLPFAFEEPFFDREVYGYDMRLAKALIKSMEKNEETKRIQLLCVSGKRLPDNYPAADIC